MSEPLKDVTLIAGPTASGKSAYAMDLARRAGGMVVNADSMQVYSVLRVITARPDDTDLAAAPHALYGHVHPSTAYSTGAWQRAVSSLLESGQVSGPIIFVGGTGLYFRALLGGLADIPEVDPGVRTKWRQFLLAEGPEMLHLELARRDPQGAAGLRPTDGQRISRALEVVESSGRPLGYWQAQPGVALVDPTSARRILLDPDRDVLRARIKARFDRMVDDGALDEVRQVLDLNLDEMLPAMRAIGVPELGQYLRGGMSLDDAIERAKIATMQYAKRQRTWFRNQFGPEWSRISA